MSLETGTYISDLVATNPLAGDPRTEGDDHIRLIKAVLKATFPNIVGAVTPTQAELNFVDGVTSAIQAQIDARATNTALALKAALSGAAFTGAISAPSLTLTSPLAIAQGGTGQITAALAFAALKQAASTTASGVVELATGPEAQAGVDATRAVTPDNLGDCVIGMGQTYQDMTASRSSGVTYTNSTGRTIAVSAWSTTGGVTNQSALAYVNGVQIAANSWYSNGAGYSASVYFLVPPGASYSILFQNAGVTTKWFELR